MTSRCIKKTLLTLKIPYGKAKPYKTHTSKLFPLARTFSHLNHYYGANELRKQTLFDINLDIYSGEIVIMTGPSGSGKTTLLTLMGGLRSLQSEPQNFGRRCVVPVSGN